MTATLRSTGVTQTASENEEAIAPAPTGSTGFSRRRAMAVCSMTLLGAAGLAACGGGSSDSASSDSSGSAGTTTADTPAADSSTSADSSSSGSGGEVIAKESSIATGDAASFELDGAPIIVAMPDADKPAAFSAVCPHQGATVAVKGDQIVCPLHGSVFEKLTGAFVSGPAAGKSLTPVAVKVDGGNIVTA
jgi:nitrite reductase/ring-hydroxylating ferredoxin subunit